MSFNIQQPLMPPHLAVAYFFADDEGFLEGQAFADSDQSYGTAENLVIRQSTLTRIVMQNTRLERFEASNVIFEKCDFANLTWIGGSFHQVIFKQCKLTGTNFSESFLRDCQFIECKASLSSFSNSKFNRVLFDDCELEEADFLEVNWTKFALTNSLLNRTNWLGTKVATLDFTSDTFEEILLPQQLRGLVVNQEQAITIAVNLGLVVQ